MNTMKLSILFISLVLLFSGFSSPVFSADLSVVKPDKGLIIFYRVKKMKGSAIRVEINDSAKGSSGSLSNGTKIQKDLEPGDHTFTVRSPSIDGQDSITISVEVGKTYFVRGEILWGWPAGRPKFVRVTDSEAQSEIAKIADNAITITDNQKIFSKSE